MTASVLALDLASVSGWAVGEPGGEPEHGSIRFASKGASHEAIFAKAHTWMKIMIAERQPEIVVWEAPLAGFKNGKTTADASTILFGLPAVIGTVAFLRGIYDIRKADTRDVRLHFIGCNPKRAQAKPMVADAFVSRWLPRSTRSVLSHGRCSRGSLNVILDVLAAARTALLLFGGGERVERAHNVAPVDSEQLGDYRIGISAKDFTATLVDFGDGGVRVRTVRRRTTYWRRGRWLLYLDQRLMRGALGRCQRLGGVVALFINTGGARGGAAL